MTDTPFSNRSFHSTEKRTVFLCLWLGLRCRDTRRVTMFVIHTDGLPVGRADGTGTQARELVVVALAQPVDGGDACFRGEKIIGQDAWLRAEGMFGGEQELATVAGGVGSEQEATAGGLLQGRSGTRRVQGVGRGLAQGAGQQDGTGVLAGEFD